MDLQTSGADAPAVAAAATDEAAAAAVRPQKLQASSRTAAACCSRRHRACSSTSKSCSSSQHATSSKETEAVLRLALQPVEVLLDRTTAMLAAVADPEVYRQYWAEVGRGAACDSSSSSNSFSCLKSSNRVYIYDSSSVRQGRYSCSGSSCSIAVPPRPEGSLVDLLPLFMSRTDTAAAAATAAERLRFLPAAAASVAVALKDADDAVYYCLWIGLLGHAADAPASEASAAESAQQQQQRQQQGDVFQLEEQRCVCLQCRSSSSCCYSSSKRDVECLPFSPCLFEGPTEGLSSLHQQEKSAKSFLQGALAEEIPPVAFGGPPASWVSIHPRPDGQSATAATAPAQPATGETEAGAAAAGAAAAGAAAAATGPFEAVTFPTNLYGYHIGRRFASASRDSALLLRKQRLRSSSSAAATEAEGRRTTSGMALGALGPTAKEEDALSSSNSSARCMCSCCSSADALLQLLERDPPTFVALDESNSRSSYIYQSPAAAGSSSRAGLSSSRASRVAFRNREGVWVLRSAVQGEPFAVQAVLHLRLSPSLLQHAVRRRRLASLPASSSSSSRDRSDTRGGEKLRDSSCCCCCTAGDFVSLQHQSSSRSKHGEFPHQYQQQQQEAVAMVSLVKLLLLEPHRTFPGEPTPRVLRRVRRMAQSWFRAKKIALLLREQQHPQAAETMLHMGPADSQDSSESPSKGTSAAAAASAAAAGHCRPKPQSLGPSSGPKQLQLRDRYSLPVLPEHTLRVLLADAAVEASYTAELSAMADALIIRLSDLACLSRPAFSRLQQGAAEEKAAHGAAVLPSSSSSSSSSATGKCAVGLRWRRDFYCFEIYAAVEMQEGDKRDTSRKETGKCFWRLLLHEVLQPCVLDAVSVHLAFSEAIRRLSPCVRMHPHLLQLLQHTPEGQQLLAAAAVRSSDFTHWLQQQHKQQQQLMLLQEARSKEEDISSFLPSHEGSESFQWCSQAAGGSSPAWAEDFETAAAAAAALSKETVGALNLDQAVQRLALLSRPVTAVSLCGVSAAEHELQSLDSAATTPAALISVSRQTKQELLHAPDAVLTEQQLLQKQRQQRQQQKQQKQKEETADGELLASYLERVRQEQEERSHSVNGRCCCSSAYSCFYSAGVCAAAALQQLQRDTQQQQAPGSSPCSTCCFSFSQHGDTPLRLPSQSSKPAAAQALLHAVLLPGADEDQQQQTSPFFCEYIGVTDVAAGDTITVSLLLTLLFPTQRLLLPRAFCLAPQKARPCSAAQPPAAGAATTTTQEGTHSAAAMEQPDCASCCSTTCSSNRSSKGCCCSRACCCFCSDSSSWEGDAATEIMESGGVVLTADSAGQGGGRQVTPGCDLLGPLLLSRQQRQQQQQQQQHTQRPAAAACTVGGSKGKAMGGSLLPKDTAGEDSSASSTVSSSTLWARTVSGGVCLRVTSAEEGSSSRESDSEEAYSPVLQQQLLQKPAGDTLVLPGAAAQQHEDGGSPARRSSTSTSSSSNHAGDVAGRAAMASADWLLASLREVASFVCEGTEVDVGFPVSAEVFEEAGEEVEAICRAPARERAASPLRPLTSAAAAAAASSGQHHHQAQSHGSHLLDPTSPCAGAADLGVHHEQQQQQQQQQQSELRVLPALFASLYQTGAAAKRRLFPRHRVLSTAAASAAAAPQSQGRRQQSASVALRPEEQQQGGAQRFLSLPAQAKEEGQHLLRLGPAASSSSGAGGGRSSGRSSSRSGSNTPTGVYFDAARQLWRCQWRAEGRLRSKGFAVARYGSFEEAKEACIAYRELVVQAGAAAAAAASEAVAAASAAAAGSAASRAAAEDDQGGGSMQPHADGFLPAEYGTSEPELQHPRRGEASSQGVLGGRGASGSGGKAAGAVASSLSATYADAVHQSRQAAAVPAMPAAAQGAEAGGVLRDANSSSSSSSGSSALSGNDIAQLLEAARKKQHAAGSSASALTAPQEARLIEVADDILSLLDQAKHMAAVEKQLQEQRIQLQQQQQQQQLQLLQAEQQGQQLHTEAEVVAAAADTDAQKLSQLLVTQLEHALQQQQQRLQQLRVLGDIEITQGTTNGEGSLQQRQQLLLNEVATLSRQAVHQLQQVLQALLQQPLPQQAPQQLYVQPNAHWQSQEVPACMEQQEGSEGGEEAVKSAGNAERAKREELPHSETQQGSASSKRPRFTPSNPTGI